MSMPIGSGHKIDQRQMGIMGTHALEYAWETELGNRHCSDVVPVFSYHQPMPTVRGRVSTVLSAGTFDRGSFVQFVS
jgi:hypothetical protein